MEDIPEFALCVGLAEEANYPEDEFFRFFPGIESLCDFIEKRLIVQGWLLDFESTRQSDSQRVSKTALEITEEIRRGYELCDDDRKRLNAAMKPLAVRLIWWGKASELLKSDCSAALLARRYYYDCKWSEGDSDWDDKKRLDPIDFPKPIKKAQVQEFFACLQQQMREELEF